MRVFFFAGNVLEEFLDEIDVGENHAAAAVALEADGVEGVTARDIGLVQLAFKSNVPHKWCEYGGGGPR
jgi:hypothetical protein